MAAKKKLTLNAIKTADKQAFTQTEHEIGGYTLKVDDTFRPSKIRLFLEEYASDIEYMTQNGVDLNSKIISNYAMLLAIKYFTSLVVPADTVEEKVAVLKVLIDTDFYGKIIELFPESELDKLLEAMHEFSKELNEQLENIKERLVGMTEELNDEETINKITKEDNGNSEEE